MDNMYAIIYSAIYIYDANWIKLGRFKRTVTSERHVAQSALDIWAYGDITDCIEKLTNFHENLKKDKYKDIECTYDIDNNLIRLQWVSNLNTNKYDQLQSLYIAPMMQLLTNSNRKEVKDEN